MSLTRKEVVAIAEHYLELQNKANRIQLAIDYDYIREFDEGFIIYVDSKKYMETRRIGDALVGILPFVVDKGDGSIFQPKLSVGYPHLVVMQFKEAKNRK